MSDYEKLLVSLKNKEYERWLTTTGLRVITVYHSDYLATEYYFNESNELVSVHDIDEYPKPYPKP